MPKETEAKKIKKESRTSRSLKLLLKIVITALCFWYISTKIDFQSTLDTLAHANWIYLSAALLFFVVSKLFSAFRLNIYFKNLNLQLTSPKNIKLYWLGMFYNLFLPGAISGDAYKVILLNRRYNTSYKKLSAAVLLDRFSGITALGVILAIYGAGVLPDYKHDVFVIASAILAFSGFYFAIRYLFKAFLPGFVATFLWGLAVQLSQVVCIYFILLGLGLPLSQHQ